MEMNQSECLVIEKTRRIFIFISAHRFFKYRVQHII